MQRLQLSRVRGYAIFGIAPRSDDWFGSFASDHSQRPRGINIRFTPQATELLSCREMTRWATSRNGSRCSYQLVILNARYFNVASIISTSLGQTESTR